MGNFCNEIIDRIKLKASFIWHYIVDCGSIMSPGVFGDLVGSIDEGTSSARFVLFKAGTADIVCFHQLQLRQITPAEGWVEQDADEILYVVGMCIEKTVEKLIKLGGFRSVGASMLYHLCSSSSFLYIYHPNTKEILFFSRSGYRCRWCNEPAGNDSSMEPHNGQTITSCDTMAGRTHLGHRRWAGRTFTREKSESLSKVDRIAVVNLFLRCKNALVNR